MSDWFPVNGSNSVFIESTSFPTEAVRNMEFLLDIKVITDYYKDKIKGPEIIAFINGLLTKLKAFNLQDPNYHYRLNGTNSTMTDYLETVFGDGPGSLRSAFDGTDYRAGKIVKNFKKCMIPLTRGGARKTSKRGRKRRHRQSRHRQSR
jgi:hypothetical protein